MSALTVTIPVLSTGHLAPYTAKVLEGSPAWVTVAPYDEGYFVLVPPDGGTPEGTPGELREVYEWARSKGFSWVRFDSIGDYVDGLPVFDW